MPLEIASGMFLLCGSMMLQENEITIWKSP